MEHTYEIVVTVSVECLVDRCESAESVLEYIEVLANEWIREDVEFTIRKVETH